MLYIVKETPDRVREAYRPLIEQIELSFDYSRKIQEVLNSVMLWFFHGREQQFFENSPLDSDCKKKLEEVAREYMALSWKFPFPWTTGTRSVFGTSYKPLNQMLEHQTPFVRDVMVFSLLMSLPSQNVKDTDNVFKSGVRHPASAIVAELNPLLYCGMAPLDVSRGEYGFLLLRAMKNAGYPKIRNACFSGGNGGNPLRYPECQSRTGICSDTRGKRQFGLKLCPKCRTSGYRCQYTGASYAAA